MRREMWIFQWAGSRVGELAGHHSRVTSLCCNSAALCLYSGGQDRFILQWDARPTAGREEDDTDAEEKRANQINPYTVDTWSSSDDENS
jgi:hypothetical protein